MEETITLTMKEQKKHEAIRESLKGIIRVKEAAMLLKLSERQVYRLRRRVKEEGIKGVVHKLRGKQSSRKISFNTEEQVKRLYPTKYYGFNITHFTELLNEKEKVFISREKTRKILRENNLYPKKPKKQPKHRIRREPMPKEGILSQLDTSEHLWIPSLKGNIYLIVSIDDATNKIQDAKFVLSDSTMENMRFLKEFFMKKGMPWAFYIDRDSKFKTTRHQGIHYNLKGEPYPETQIERALNELGIKIIYAYSPQAKGRIERDFQTLQDRLINEMKLNNISTIEEANHYLKEEFIPKWNKKFAHKAKIEGEAYRPAPKNLDDILCIKEKRKGYADNTISYKGKRFQILPDPYRASYFKAELDVYEHTDGEVSILYKERRLKYIFMGELEGSKPSLYKKEEEDFLQKDNINRIMLNKILSKNDIFILQKR